MFISAAQYPFSIDVFEELMYWTSRELGKVVFMNKFGSLGNNTLQSGLSMPKALKVFHKQQRYDLSSMYSPFYVNPLETSYLYHNVHALYYK